MAKISDDQGLTMAELVVTIFVLGVTLSSILMFFTNARVAEQYARDSTVAVSHGEYLMEEMRARDTLANITATDWTAWSATKGLNSLPTETINAVYTNSSADPLEITVNVGWVRNTRSYLYSLLTRMTK